MNKKRVWGKESNIIGCKQNEIRMKNNMAESRDFEIKTDHKRI
jgi:hypothetical protein